MSDIDITFTVADTVELDFTGITVVGNISGGGGSGVTSVSGTAPIVVTSPTTTPNVSLGPLDASQTTTGVFAPARLGSGTADANAFLRGDSTWTDDVPLQVNVKNTSGGALTKGTPVYATGTVGATTVIEVSAADASVSAKMPAIGLLMQDLAVNGTGLVMIMGTITGLSTTGYNINSGMFVAPGGGLTNTRPTAATDLVQNVARVTRVHATTGSVMVLGPGRTNDVPNLIATNFLATSGTASASTFLRGDQSWSSVDHGILSGLADDDHTQYALADGTRGVFNTNNAQARMNGQSYIGPDGFVGQALNNGTYAFTPDSAVLDIVGDLEITARIQPDNWLLGANQGIVGKRNVIPNYSYWATLFGGRLALQWSTDGTNVVSANGLTIAPYTNESAWIRITLDVDNGAGGSTTTFYTAPDSPTEPTSWTQLGVPIVNAGVTSIFAGTAIVEFGSNLLGGNQIKGIIKRGIIRNGIGGTIVCDADFDAAQEDSITFNESSSNAAVVSINGTRYLYGVPSTNFVSTGTISMSANQTHYMPFEVTASSSVDMFILQGSGTAGTVRVGIFASDKTLQPTGSCLAQAEIPYTAVTTTYNKQIVPVTLAPGLYLLALNSTTSAVWTRGAGGISPLSPTLSTNMFASRIFASSQTMTGAYTTGPLWNSKTDGATPHLHPVFLRWKAA